LPPKANNVCPFDKVLIKIFDVIAIVCGFIRRVPFSGMVVEKCLNSPQFEQIFKEADVHGNGSLGLEEVYTVVLRFYILVAQYTFVVARHIPTREDVQNIITLGDLNKDGGIGFNEFKKLMLMLCEGVATQLAAQILFTVLLSPLLALCFMFLLKHTFVILPFLLRQFWFIPSFLRNDKVGLLVFVPAFNFLVMPYYLEYIFHLQSLRNPNKVRFVPDMSQFQSLPSPLESLKEITVELAERAERREEESQRDKPKVQSPMVDEDNDEKKFNEKEKTDMTEEQEDVNENVTHTTATTGSEDDLVILEKDCVSKKED